MSTTTKKTGKPNGIKKKLKELEKIVGVRYWDGDSKIRVGASRVTGRTILELENLILGQTAQT